ncbi:hypothetical protein K1T71_000674 [Dendrolimus kikuchii]|uniref:Uncharacterized protein n=1 Tax=Dendrolimus kikuchii TaxID=765133 RepID=A0ACC1DK98_9NEOP|nr:hypothetical protein K1T71_000674 [Dendrolimus kikuchii]
MSDKSFGDHTNRNIVKNPLLSSAVTGLSLEDLTHKAVLLPAAPSQTLITRSVQLGSQQTTLGDTDNVPYQSGDANYNISAINLNPLVTENVIKNEQKKLQTEFPTMESMSKASQKSQDDFDVNEYFARLQGTRYVSAPLHSHVKDDNATDLEATEENLEEINLNEPEKTETQQSLTADIAQNFSQLPNVLPHVANAVFSSFSNMLSYKSREQTPDGAKVVYHEEKRDDAVEVPLMSVDEVVKDIAPPPKEPSVIGQCSYRITTKKKVYAQIPGLSSGEAKNITINTPPNQNIKYFTPEQPQKENSMASIDTNIEKHNIEESFINKPMHFSNDNRPNLQEITNFNEAVPLAASHLSSQTILPPPPTFANIKTDSQTQKVVLPPSVVRRMSGNHSLMSGVSIPENIFTPGPIGTAQMVTTTDIPSPSPALKDQKAASLSMFAITANVSELDNNDPKIVVPMFPPNSIISSSLSMSAFEQPQAPLDAILTENKTSIFPQYGSVPVSEIAAAADKISTDFPAVLNPIKEPGIGKPNSIQKDTSLDLIHSSHSQTVSEQTSNIPSSFENSTMAINSAACLKDLSYLPPPPIADKLYSVFSPQETLHQTNIESVLLPPTSNVPPSSMFAANTLENNGQKIFQPMPYAPRRKVGHSSSRIAPISLPHDITIFNPTIPDTIAESKHTTSETSAIGPQSSNILPSVPMFSPQEVKSDEFKPDIANPFNIGMNVTLFKLDSLPGTDQVSKQPPSIFASDVHEGITTDQMVPNTSITNPIISKVEPIRPPEPPKVGASNFRMTKKKLQYYSGPIEGVGTISNNVKPIISPIEAPSFSGHLYNPQQNISDVAFQEQTTNVQSYFNSHTMSHPLQPSYDLNKENQSVQIQEPNVQVNQTFDITHSYQTPFDLASPFDIREPDIQAIDTNKETDIYNTAFDLSRATTEAYEAKTNKGFGLIGSLKSKLSLLDINKIQNTVTTFFDPSYNEPKKESVTTQVNEPYKLTDQSHQSNFEIFVPTSQQYDIQSHSQHFHQQEPYNYYQGAYPVTSHSFDSYVASQNDPLHPSHEEAAPLLTSYETSDASQPKIMPEMKEIPLASHFSNTGTTHTHKRYITTNTVLHNYPDNLSATSQVSQKQTNEINVEPRNFTSIQGFEERTSAVPNFSPSISESEVSDYRPQEHLKVETVMGSSTSKINTVIMNKQTKDIPEPNQNIFSVITPLEKSQDIITETTSISAAFNVDLTQIAESRKFDTDIVQNIPIALTSSFANTKGNETIHSKLFPLSTFSEIDKPNLELKSTVLLDPISAKTFFDFHSSTETPNMRVSNQHNTMFSFADPSTNITKDTVKKVSEETREFQIKSDENINYLKSSEIFETAALTTPDLITDLFSKFKENKDVSDASREIIHSKIIKSDLGSHSKICTDDCEDIKDLDVTKTIPDLPPAELFSKFKEKEPIETQSKSLLESITKEEMPIIGVSSVPLFGLSTIIADKSKEIKEHEDNARKMSLFETHRDSLFDRNASVSFFENIGHIDELTQNRQEIRNATKSFNRDSNIQSDETSGFKQLFKSVIDVIESDPEIITCDTCAEIKENEEKEDYVTNQLIENITSPIQLQNPVEVPLSESKTEDTLEVDNDQLEEITHITEETIETLQVQSATELLDDDSQSTNYGWRMDSEANKDSYSHTTDAQSDFTFNIDSQTLVDHDYSFKIDPNALGFYGKNSLFFDKDESGNEGTKVLPRQMSIPSAPPEEDTKSEGLDVHLIEQDAKQDFPIYEEYVIEPESDKNDVDNIEVSDTFTNRLERFKLMEETSEDNSTFAIPTSPVIMASYFDTGNYAVETHYKNMTSPIVRIPPGFEDEYRKMSLGQESCIPPMSIIFIPETSTQTKVTFTNTYTMYNQGIGFTVESNISKILEDKSPVGNFPVFPTTNVQQNTVVESKDDIICETKPKISLELESEQESSVTTPELPTIKTSINTDVIKKEEKLKSAFEIENMRTLPDSNKFFNVDSENNSSKEEENSFNRLASYFNVSPERPEHSKPFFELSQSQNHYRHESHNLNNFDQNMNANIPDDRYLANINLINDLTSPQNVIVTESIIKTVNYFTVEYDNDIKQINNSNKNVNRNTNKNSKTDTKHKINDTKDLKSYIDNSNTKIKDKNLDIKINNCKICCNFAFNLTEIDNIKVRKAMNENTVKSEGTPSNMDAPKDQSSQSVTVNFGSHIEDESSNGVDVINNESRPIAEYQPVQFHWFYRVDVEDKSIWRGFSVQDSKDLEEAFLRPDLNENTLVATDGGRYDVNIVGRIRTPVYWSDKPTNCKYVYLNFTVLSFVCFTYIARLLEYRHGVTTGEWHRRLVLPNNELVVMHGPSVMVHFLQTGSTDGYSAPPSASRPRVVRRGHDESEIEEVEPSRVDHLLLLCHGVGSACDMRFRPVEEVVEDFRTTSMQLIQSHYNNSYLSGVVHRVEVLPISWHATLHSGETGVDHRLAQITLDSIPRLRSFTNDTVLDVLLYTSPVYCQTIIDTVCKELNRIYTLFKRRNPDFEGEVSLGGHSLGSVILYDLLCHQISQESKESSASKSYVIGSPGIGQPFVNYPQLVFSPAALYALGSPIAMFECIRGVKELGMEFGLPTCKNFFNIFHPYDPIAYRIEPLINPQLKHVKPYLIPHHKGRKRMHLELKDTMARVSADIKQKLMESLRTTWNKWKSSSPPTDGQLEKVVEEEMDKRQLCDEKEDTENQTATPDMLGRLNGGRRIDYVLQEAPLEMINEYLFAMSSHVGYWESEDTMLLMLREIYDSLGVQPDSTVPQQSLTVHRTRLASDDGSTFATSVDPSVILKNEKIWWPHSSEGPVIMRQLF